MQQRPFEQYIKESKEDQLQEQEEIESNEDPKSEEDQD